MTRTEHIVTTALENMKRNGLQKMTARHLQIAASLTARQIHTALEPLDIYPVVSRAGGYRTLVYRLEDFQRVDRCWNCHSIPAVRCCEFGRDR